MTDVVDTRTRSRMMSGIKSKNTQPEIKVRSGLHRRGFRFRLHDRRVTGTPDLLLPKYSAVIFVNGCFWHGHDCAWFRLPKTRPEFWSAKIQRNQVNDNRNLASLREAGWRVCVVWECALRTGEENCEAALNQVARWLPSSSALLEIRA